MNITHVVTIFLIPGGTSIPTKVSSRVRCGSRECSYVKTHHLRVKHVADEDPCSSMHFGVKSCTLIIWDATSAVVLHSDENMLVVGLDFPSRSQVRIRLGRRPLENRFTRSNAPS